MRSLIFDISTQDSAYKFVQDFFKISGSEFIDEYIIESNNNFDIFWERNYNYIEEIDISNLKYKVLHVTSNWNNCLEIKTKGINNLQTVLSEYTALSSLLSEHGLKFDIENKIINADGRKICIDYDKYQEVSCLTEKEEYIREIGRKIYFDPQINGFFAVDDIKRYGSDIHIRPEILMNLIKLFPDLKKVEKLWSEKSKGYVISFIADFNQFAWDTFYENQDEYYEDEDSRLELKKWIISTAVSRSFDNIDGGVEIFAYMRRETIIHPEQIIDYLEID